MTRRQRQLLVFIIERIRQTGLPPKMDDMREHMGLVSRGDVHRRLVDLETFGFIRRQPHTARGIEVLRAPPGQPTAMFMPVSVNAAGDAVIDAAQGRAVSCAPLD